MPLPATPLSSLHPWTASSLACLLQTLWRRWSGGSTLWCAHDCPAPFSLPCIFVSAYNSLALLCPALNPNIALCCPIPISLTDHHIQTKQILMAAGTSASSSFNNRNGISGFIKSWPHRQRQSGVCCELPFRRCQISALCSSQSRVFLSTRPQSCGAACSLKIGAV